MTVSYRPFEHALMKYYVIPVFDSEGRYLWDFLPGANPKVNFESYDVGFAHYRKILEQHRKTQHIRLQSVRLEAVAESGGQACPPDSATASNLTLCNRMCWVFLCCSRIFR